MGFVYYFGGVKSEGAARGRLRECGLERVVPSGLLFRPVVPGPDGKDGYVAGVRGECAYRPLGQDATATGGQTWCEAAGYWIGYAEKPGPAALRRAEVQAGYPVTLGDGAEWIVPIARVAFPEVMGTRWTTLPTRVKLAAGGGTEREVLSEYRELAELAGKIWESFREESDGSMAYVADESEQVRLASLALNVNYHVGEYELANALGCFTDAALRDVFMAVLDWPSVERLRSQLAGLNGEQKKTFAACGT